MQCVRVVSLWISMIIGVCMGLGALVVGVCGGCGVWRRGGFEGEGLEVLCKRSAVLLTSSK